MSFGQMVIWRNVYTPTRVSTCVGDSLTPPTFSFVFLFQKVIIRFSLLLLTFLPYNLAMVTSDTCKCLDPNTEIMISIKCHHFRRNNFFLLILRFLLVLQNNSSHSTHCHFSIFLRFSTTSINIVHSISYCDTSNIKLMFFCK